MKAKLQNDRFRPARELGRGESSGGEGVRESSCQAIQSENGAAARRRRRVGDDRHGRTLATGTHEPLRMCTNLPIPAGHRNLQHPMFVAGRPRH